jgi:ribonuclease E
VLDDESTDTTTTSAGQPGADDQPVKAVRRRRATKASAAPAEEQSAGSTAAQSTDSTAARATGPTGGQSGDSTAEQPATVDPRSVPDAGADSAPATDAAFGAAPFPDEQGASAPAKRTRKAPAKKAAPRKRATKSGATSQGDATIADAPGDEEQATPADVVLSAEVLTTDGPAADTVDDAVETPDQAAAVLDETPDQALRAPDQAALAPDQAAAAPDQPSTGRRRSRAPAVVVTFQAPEASVATPGASTPAAEGEEPTAPRRRRRAGTSGAVSASAVLPTLLEPDSTTGPEADETVTEDDDESATGRRRRRGRRGRGRRPEGEAAEGEESGTSETAARGDAEGDAAEDAAAEDGEDGEDGDDSAAGTRRRRRRRRSASGGGAAEEAEEADVATVVHTREPRERTPRVRRDGGGVADEDGVRGIAGSTRMAAKRVRRQEGRDSGRKRAPVLTEAEFLARREAVDRVMVVRQTGERTQIAVLEDGILVEHYVTKASATSYAGNVYLGKVQNVLPSMEAAFVDVGKGRNAVLYAGEVNYDAALSGGGRKIEQVLKSGQDVLVQVSKDPIGHKGARLTSQISLPGRYLVYVPEGSMTGISRKLPEGERTRLKAILKKVVPDGAGVIIRTAAEGASEEEIAGDVRRLQAQWEVISGKAAKGGGPVLLHAEPDLVIRVVRDLFNEDFSRLVVSGDSEWDTIREYVEFVAPDLAPRLSRWTAEGDVFAEHRIDEQLLKALDRKVHLPSGGSLVIDRTEAMVVIDVNTGKYVGKGGNLEETVTRNNLEAAEEIARQLRLRDLGGIIVVDFIDMVLESNRDLVVRRLVECLGRDRTKHQVAEVTSLGLVQMTRKRVGQGLLESFSETCEACNGRGVKVHLEPVDERPVRSERDRLPKVPVRAPRPGPPPSGSAPDRAADAPADAESGADKAEGAGRPRRRRGGRGQGSAGSVNASDELRELLTDGPSEAAEGDVLEQAIDVEPAVPAPEADVIPELADQPAPELEDLPVLEVPDLPPAPVGDAPPAKRRRRAASRPAGSPVP